MREAKCYKSADKDLEADTLDTIGDQEPRPWLRPPYLQPVVT